MKALLIAALMGVSVSASAGKQVLLAECRTSNMSVSVVKQENGVITLAEKGKLGTPVNRYNKGHYISYVNQSAKISLSVYGNCFSRSGLCGSVKIKAKSRELWCLNGKDVSDLADQLEPMGDPSQM